MRTRPSPLKKIFSVTADLLKSTTTQTPGGEATTLSAIKKEELFLASRILARAHIQHNLLFLPSSLARAKNGYVFRLDTLKEDIPVEYNYLYFCCQDNELQARYRDNDSIITIHIPDTTLQQLSHGLVSLKKLQEHPSGLIVALKEPEALRAVLNAFRLKEKSFLGHFFDDIHSNTWLGYPLYEFNLTRDNDIIEMLRLISERALPYLTAADLTTLIDIYPFDNTALSHIFLNRMFREAIHTLESTVTPRTPLTQKLSMVKPATPVIDAIKNLQTHISKQCKSTTNKQTNYLMLAESVRDLTQKIKQHTLTQADIDQFKKDSKVLMINRTLESLLMAFLGAMIGFFVGAIAGALPGAIIGAGVGASIGGVGMGVKATFFNRPVNRFTEILKTELKEQESPQPALQR